jgi:hypothetical protein
MSEGGSSTAATCGSSKPASTKDHNDSDSALLTGKHINCITLNDIKRQEEYLIGIGSQFDNGKYFTTLVLSKHMHLSTLSL